MTEINETTTPADERFHIGLTNWRVEETPEEIIIQADSSASSVTLRGRRLGVNKGTSEAIEFRFSDEFLQDMGLSFSEGPYRSGAGNFRFDGTTFEVGIMIGAYPVKFLMEGSVERDASTRTRTLRIPRFDVMRLVHLLNGKVIGPLVHDSETFESYMPIMEFDGSSCIRLDANGDVVSEGTPPL